MSRVSRVLLLIARGIAAVAAGEVTMVVLITLVQENLFGGVGWNESSLTVLAISGALTFLAAVAGGGVAGWIARGFPMTPAIIIAAAVPVETTWLIATGRTADPLWFDVIAAGSLVVGLLLGAWGIARLGSTRTPRPATTTSGG